MWLQGGSEIDGMRKQTSRSRLAYAEISPVFNLNALGFK